MRNTLFILFAAAGILLRLVPHPWNVTPLEAAALFSGAYVRGRSGLAALVASLAVSDLILGIHPTLPFTWLSFVAVFFIGRALSQAGGFKIALGSLAGSVLFFVITNLGVFFVGGLYPMTWQGLADCFVLALPFFRNSVLGNLAYTAVLFGSAHAILRSSVSKAPVRL